MAPDLDPSQRVPYLLRPLMRAFERVLSDAGEAELAASLPWRASWGEPADSASPPADGRALQAHSIAFHLLQQAEALSIETARQSARREGRLREHAGSWEQHLSRAVKAGHDPVTIATAIAALRVEPVLTAHPTEAKRQTVLQHHRAVYALLSEWDAAPQQGAERRLLQGRLEAEIERLWRTGEVLLEKPEVADERRNILYYLARVFPRVLVSLGERLEEAWESAGLDPAILREHGGFPRLRFGDWVGGDRDGHPLVTPEVTAETLRRFRAAAVALVGDRLTALAPRLSLFVPAERTGERLGAWLQARRRILGSAAPPEHLRRKGEPFRQALLLMRASLPPAKGPVPDGFYDRAADLIADLHMLREELCASGAARIARTDLDPLLRHLEVFGFHLASVDIRQNSAFHDRALEQLLDAAGEAEGGAFATWPEPRRHAFLLEELESSRPFAHAEDAPGDEAHAVVACLRVLAEHHRKRGREGLGSLIVSMTRSTSDLLAVYVLAREAGLLSRGPEGLRCPLAVVPLFETIPDLEAAPAIMDTFLSLEIVRRSLRHQATEEGLAEPVQEVMVGYSDSGKDGGFAASFQALARAQGEVAAVGRRHGIRIRFFHGRGGTIGRGAGPTHRFLAALPAGSLRGDLRLTEQGETIEQKYGQAASARQHLELLLAGSLGGALRDLRAPQDPPRLRDALGRVAEHAEAAYRRLVEHPGFLDFFSQATPIDAIEQSRIGSRPSRRTGRRTLADLRAIPWVFAWNQARFNLPGWFGLGSGLDALEAEDPDLAADLRAAKRVATRWAPVHYLVSNAATAWAMASPAMMEEYAGLCTDSETRSKLLGSILEEHRRLEAQLEDYYGASPRSARPRIQQVIDLRDAALVPLHRRQITLLREWRAGEMDASEQLPELLLSMNAIAAGLGATG